MTPPPDPVAALAEALHRIWSRSGSEGATIEDEAEYLHERLTDAGWTLSHDSERRSAVIGSERSDNKALVERVAEGLSRYWIKAGAGHDSVNYRDEARRLLGEPR